MEKLKSMSEFKKICQNVLTEKDDWYERIIVRKISIYISRLFVAMRISANKVTALSFIIGAIGIVLVGFRPAWIVLLGCIAMQVWYLLDKCDGEVARYWKYEINNKVAKSKLEADLSGVFLDSILHHIVHSFLFISISFSLCQQMNQIYMFGFGFSAAISMILINLIVQCKDSIMFNKLRVLKMNINYESTNVAATRQMSFASKMFSLVHYLCTFPFVINIVMICGIFNLLTFDTDKMFLKPFVWFLIFYGTVSPVIWISKFLHYVYKKKIDSEFNQITNLS